MTWYFNLEVRTYLSIEIRKNGLYFFISYLYYFHFLSCDVCYHDDMRIDENVIIHYDFLCSKMLLITSESVGFPINIFFKKK